METPFLDQLIYEHQNHIESVEASSYAGIQETRKQLAELEAIKAIIVTHCCMGEAEQLFCDCEIPKPTDPYDVVDKHICHDCKQIIAK